MQRIEIDAHAKINLSLDVINKRFDGYHNVKMIMQTVELCDKVLINRIDKGIQLKVIKAWLPENARNIAYKAAGMMIEKYKIKSGVSINIEKNIPVSAGLAGGSADAAAVLKGMNELFDLSATPAELIEIAVSLGADVPYCLRGGTAIAEGIGEKLTEIKQLRPLDILIVKPNINVSTRWVYENLNIEEIIKRPDTEMLAANIENDEIEVFAKNTVNVLETVTVGKYPVIRDIKDLMIENGAVGSIMSGSGPSVFGIFDDNEKAIIAQNAILRNEITGKDCKSFLTKTCECR
jgi:4-diphosphocytidyl-2-C-methyl-D-erythritol kinase